MDRPITASPGRNRVIGTSEEAIYESWRTVAQGSWPVGDLPELWDGKAAGRIARVLLGLGR